jgi:hypothetical protein
MLTQRVATSAAPQTASRSNRMPSGCSPLRAAGARCACTRAGPTRLSPQERATRPLGKPDATFVAGFKTWLELGTGSAGTRRRFRIIAPMPINERERPNGEETGEPLTRRKAVSLLHRLGQASICARRWARARLGRRAGALVKTAASRRNQRSAAARSKCRLLSSWTTRRSAALLIGVDAVHRHDLGSRWPLTTEAREAVAFAIESRRSRRPSPQTGLCVRASGPLSRRGIRSARKVDHPPPVRWRRPPERTFWRPRSGSSGW